MIIFLYHHPHGNIELEYCHLILRALLRLGIDADLALFGGR